MKRLRGFTLAEVLITLAIIGVVAAISIPSVISNSQQQEFKTGLRKAVSVLNSAITMNMAIDGESPYENADLFNYLQRHMNVLKTSHKLEYSVYSPGSNDDNAVIYTVDGMRFEFNQENRTAFGHNRLHESNLTACEETHPEAVNEGGCGGCGSLGLAQNVNNTTKRPCLILVDVNGDKKPTPSNVNCKNVTCAAKDNKYKYILPGTKKVNDIFGILITDDRAIPFGVTAQKAMYNAQQ